MADVATLPEPLAEVDAWLADYRALWEARIGRLDDYLNALQARENEDDQQHE